VRVVFVWCRCCEVDVYGVVFVVFGCYDIVYFDVRVFDVVDWYGFGEVYVVFDCCVGVVDLGGYELYGCGYGEYVVCDDVG